MDPPPQDCDINPYLPPANADGAAAPEGPPVLKDLRLRGWLAISAISLQCVMGFASMFLPITSTVMLGRITVVIVALAILSMILFLRWLLGVAVNTLRINPRSGITPGWSVGCYFVPLVNWVLPCVHMRAFIRECHPEGAPAGMQGLAVVWWVTFLFRGKRPVGILSMASWGEWLWLGVVTLCTVVSWIIVCFLITRISRRHFEFRWSDIPAARRPGMLSQVAEIARRRDGAQAPPGPVGSRLPPRRVAQRPISLEEQNRLIHQLDSNGKPDSPPP